MVIIMTKRLISLILALLLAFTTLCASAEERLCAEAFGALSYSDFAGFKAAKSGGIMLLSDDMTLSDVRDAIMRRETVIDVSDFAVPYISGGAAQPYISSFMGTLIECYPELFIIERHFSYMPQNGYLRYIYPNYKYDSEETEVQLDKFYTYINNISAHISDDWSDLEKVIYIHDYLAANYDYDTDYGIYDAFTFFKQKEGVCESYALAFCAIARNVGLECTQVRSVNQNHLWNVVSIDGEYYHLDVTWDDPIGNEVGRVNRDFFLMSDEQTKAISTTMTNTSTGIKYTATREDLEILGDVYISCTSTRFSDGYIWEDLHQPFVNVDGEWYTIKYGGYNANTYLSKVSSDWKSTSRVARIGSYVWSAYPSGYWPGYYGGLFAVGNTVYTNTPSGLWYCDFDGNAMGTVNVAPFVGVVSTDIYGSSYDLLRGEIVIEYKTDPNADEIQRFAVKLPRFSFDCEGIADALIRTRCIIAKQLNIRYDPYMDMNGDMLVDVRDLVNLKKILVM